jgi:hypothetical protein
MSGPQQSSQLLTAARLFAKTSARGADYLTGRWGNVRVLVMPNKNFIEGDARNGHSHVLMLGEAGPYQPKPKQVDLPLQQSPALVSSGDENPPWDSEPAARPHQPYGRAYGARQPADRLKKRVTGGRTELVNDPVPF